MTVMNNNYQIISEAFEQYMEKLNVYVSRRINDSEEAADIVQDVFLRLLSYDIITSETIKSLAFTIANNLVVDHLRRHYKRNEVMAVAASMERQRYVLTPEQEAAFHDLAHQESCVMSMLSPATRNVYEMTQKQDMSIEEISLALGISRRTVECHQFKGRKFVREQLRKII